MSLSITATATATAPLNPMSFQTNRVDSPSETFLYHHSLYQSFQPSRFDRESPDLMCCLPLSRFLSGSPDLS